MKRGIAMGNLIKISRFISLILRHKPETMGITLDEHQNIFQRKKDYYIITVWRKVIIGSI